MAEFEYRVVPAPKRGVKSKTARTVEDQFANALTQSINEAARDGWEYLRTDTLPCEERQGLTGRVTTYQNMLVFRRITAEAAANRLRAAAELADTQRAAQVSPALPPIAVSASQSAPTPVTAPVAAPAAAPVAAGPRLDKTPPTGSQTGAQTARPATLAATPELRADTSTRMAAA